MKQPLSLTLLSIALLTGCETIQTPHQRQKMTAREQAEKRMTDEKLRRLQGSVETATMENARLSQEVQQLRSDIYALNQKLGELGSSVHSLDVRQQQDKQEIASKVLGQLKTLEQKQQAAAPGSREGMRIHTVESGHTLSAIASAYGTTVKAIKQANNLKNDVIQIGQKIYIPQ